LGMGYDGSSMRALRLQYFLAFAVLGSIVPYLPVLLREGKGLTDGQVGDIASLMGWAIVLGPVAMTLLADLRIESRTLLGLTFLGSGAALAALLTTEGFWPIFAVFGVHALLAMPIIQVQDGLNFTVQQQRREAGEAAVPYHRVRVWGTLGFMVPAVVLYVWLAADGPIEVALVVAVAFSLLGVVNAFWLPAVRAKTTGSAGPPPDIPAPRNGTNGGRPTLAQRAAQLPTVAALRAMCQPRVAVFAGAMWLCHLAAAGYYTFYPVYLTEQIGIENQWLGLIANIGVTVEIGFMLAFGFLLRRLGLRALMAIAAGSMALRLGLLYAWPNVWIAVGTQLLHGFTVLLIHVAPPVYLNQRAEPSFRSSIQGLYAMLVYGTGRIVGNMAAGRVAEWDLLAVFAVGAALCALAAVLFAVIFSDRGSSDPGKRELDSLQSAHQV
ncbi:MAG: MFS transporter, partial [Phycisphaeraceae bacterium]